MIYIVFAYVYSYKDAECNMIDISFDIKNTSKKFKIGAAVMKANNRENKGHFMSWVTAFADIMY